MVLVLYWILVRHLTFAMAGRPRLVSAPSCRCTCEVLVVVVEQSLLSRRRVSCEHRAVNISVTSPLHDVIVRLLSALARHVTSSLS